MMEGKMATEQAKENRNPFAVFKGLGKAIVDVTGFKLHEQEAMLGGAAAKEDTGHTLDPRAAAWMQKGM